MCYNLETFALLTCVLYSDHTVTLQALQMDPRRLTSNFAHLAIEHRTPTRAVVNYRTID